MAIMAHWQHVWKHAAFRAVDEDAGATATPAVATLDTARQEKARRYARQRQALMLVNLGISAIVIMVLLFSGLSFWLRDVLGFVAGWEPIAGWEPWRTALYFVALGAAVAIIDAPLSWYGGYVLPHRYGLSTQRIGAWLWDGVKSLAISLPLEIVAVEFIYLLLAVSPDAWWLWAGLAILLFSVVLANLAPILLLPLFYRLTPLPDGDVRQRALALAEQAHTRVRGIYSMNMSTKTTAANAAVMGLGNTRRIVIGDTLLNHYTPDEIEVVVAHELGHQVHRDIPKLILVQTVTMLGGLYLVNLALHAVVGAFPAYHGLSDPATMPLVAAVLGVFGLIVLPLTNGFSRLVERQADGYALESTGKVTAFISAMTRLANQNLSELNPNPLVEFFLYTHPSIGNRLAFARKYAGKTETNRDATGARG
ncbi:MAG TPA: M48 family metallopeptidase [Ktedonobacterales bacterium]|nr:M48 family metallopeptidase [Ktedonobacterales bacterium]